MNPADYATIHKPLATRDRGLVIFYLHGGGLLYGERDDLPKPYIQMLIDAGYTLVCADYPLAPEYALPDIVDFTYALWRASIAEPVIASAHRGSFLFGRSAGAFLSLLLAREIHLRGDEAQPLGILDFYGYHTLCDEALRRPNRAYTSLPVVNRDQIEKIHQPAGALVTSGPKSLRYSLYVHARQHENAWIELLGLDGRDETHTAEAWSLGAEDIAVLPPLFITASSGDEDIPFRLSKTLARQAPNTVMKPVYYLPHDFDRDVTAPDGRRIYEKAIEWMDGLTTLPQ